MTDPKLSATKLALATRSLWQQDGPLRVAEPIAIVGMGLRFPNGVHDMESLWQTLLKGEDHVREVPADRWELDEWFDADPATPGRLSTRWGGFLEDVRGFDAAFFDISPREAERMDPQQRISLEVACEAIEHAGIPLSALRGTSTGVYFSSYHNDYGLLQYADLNTVSGRTLTGSLHSVIPNRISYALGLRGPSMTIDSACSSSLVAVHIACQALRSRDCDAALVGGVNLMITPHVTVALSKGGFMSPTGHCWTFDANADGFVRSEGCAVIMVKRLSDAVAAGDRVLGVIRGSAVNQDGTSTTLSAPNGLAQADLVRSALRSAGLTPDDISVLEAHGTGTELGDPIETDALCAAFSSRDHARGPCWIGSLKSNFGHMEAAAGLAGLIKSVLILEKGIVPPHALFTSANPHLNLEGTQLSIAREPMKLDATEPRRAGVSAFGLGGTNAHVILEQSPAGLTQRAEGGDGPYLLPLSARSAKSLTKLAARYAALLRDGANAGAVARAASRRRAHFIEYRSAVTAPDAEALIRELDALALGSRPPVAGATEPPLCFVFSGQGTQWPGMAIGLRDADPVFAAELERVDAAFGAAGDIKPMAELERPAGESRLDRTDVAQATMFTVQAALLKVLAHRGIRPAVVIGHSVGELAAAYAAGLMSLDDAVAAVSARGTAMQSAFDTGRMVAVRMTEAAAAEFVRTHALPLSVAAINGPVSVVMSGAAETVNGACALLKDAGMQHSLLDVRFAFHSDLMQAAAEQLRSAAAPVHGSGSDVTFVSSVTGTEIGAISYDYLAQNVRSPVRFHDAVRRAVELGVRHFIEIGPHPALGNGIVETAEAAGAAAQITCCQHRERDALGSLQALTASVYEWGCNPDWSAVHPGPNAPVDLPAYPWLHTPHWLPGAVPLVPATAGAPVARNVGFPGRSISSPALGRPVFELDATDSSLGAFEDHRVGEHVRLPATGLLELFRTAAAAAGVTRPVVGSVSIMQAVEPHAIDRIQVVLAPGRLGPAEIYVHNADDTWLSVARADVSESAGATHDRARDVLAHCDAHATMSAMSPQTLYAQLEESGLAFGPTYRLLDSMSANGTCAAGTIATDRAPAWTGAVNPAVLDAAAHLCIGILSARDGNAPARALLPWAADGYHVLGTGSPAHASAILRDAGAQGASFDVFLLDDTGAPVVWLEGWHLRRAQIESQTLRISNWDAEPVPAASRDVRRWIVIDDDAGLAAAVCATLADLGHTAVTFADAHAAAMHLADSGWSGMLHLGTAGVGDPDGDGGVLVESALVAAEPLLALARHVATDPAPFRCVLVTRGVQQAEMSIDGPAPLGAAALGILRALRAEAPDVECVALDLDGTETLIDAAAAIVAEMLAGDVASDAEAAIRNGVRLVHRSAMQDLKPLAAVPVGVVQLVHENPGTLDGFALRPLADGALPEGHVRIHVLAAGLNFRDVLISLGSYPDSSDMGFECCGIVTECGAGVSTFEVGDRVITFWPGCFACEVIVPVGFVFLAPRTLTPAEAATLPVAYGTAWHALVDIGQLEAGQSVLIHAGAGGVGQAAIRLAQHFGARVFATAGSETKRTYLRDCGVAGAFDSRSSSFAADLLAAAPDGVDIVLNSLIGDLIPAGMSCLRSRGIFIELGKREILSQEEVRRLREDVRYDAFDLRDVALADASVLPRIFAGLNEAVEAGAVPPLPAVTLPLSNAESGFRRMARAQHIGKIVFLPPTPPARGEAGWTVITGGTGGMGVATLQWALETGARRAAIWSRRDASPELRDRMEALASEHGAEVVTARVDVADAAQVEAALTRLRESAPISGVIHAAGVLDDGTLAQLTAQRFAGVLRPKLAGAWNLHRATLNDPLRFFVLYSAVGPFIDAAGQGSYAAANAFLDALAVRRRAMGLPAVSIRWGLFSGGGMAERLGAHQQQRWERKGLAWLDVGSGGSAFAAALSSDEPQVFAVQLARRATSGPAQSAAASTGAELSDRLRSLPPAERVAAAVDHISTFMTAMLGLPTAADPDVPLRDLGLDSLSAIELRNALTVAAGTPLPATLAFDYPTITAIARFVLDRMGLTDGRHAEDKAATAADDEIDGLSDEEAEAQLLAELALMSSESAR